VPTYWFKTKDIDPKTFFKYREGTSHPANETAVANGQIDLATDYDRNLNSMLERNLIPKDSVKVVWTSEPLPNDALVVRKGFDATLTAKVREALELVQLGELGARSASKLSGGQQQRVALARAFVFSPSVLLFDEPLSNLDAKLRAEMRVELKELQRRLDITSVYVTHDLEEALAISDRIVVMRDGVIEQVGTPGEIYDRPRNTFVADFVGSANLIRGRRRPDLEHDGLVVIETSGGTLVHGTPSGQASRGDALMAVRTVRLRLDRARPATSVNAWPARIRQRVFQGDFTQYHVEWDGRVLIVRLATADPLAEGDEVYVSADPRYCVLLEE